MASPAIRVEKGDLRFKQFKQKAGILIVFAVDASGSMALNRIHQAKGALLRLLGQSYLHRDQVALVSFRGKTAEVLLEPSQSVELAKRALDALPVGGGTPLSAGLRTVFHLVRRARQKGGRPTLLVLFTDGHANVAFDSGDSANGRAAIWPQIEKTCAALRREGIVSLVVDTSRRDAGGEEATRLAQLLDGRHFCLRNPEAGVHDEVAQALERLRI